MKRDTERAVRAALGGRKKNKLLLRRYLPALVLAAAFFALVCFDLFVFPLEYLWAFAYSPNLPPRGEGELRVHFIDVGQGDCTVLEFPDGKTMIVDGGDGRAETHMRVLGYCRGLGIDTFDWALLTHADSDHVGGLDDALNYFGADTVFLPAAGTEGEGYREVRLAAERAGARLRTAQMFESGISSRRERFYYWMLLSPFSQSVVPPAQGEETNDSSAVLYLEYAGRTFLLTGDAPSAVEDRLAEAYTETAGAVFERPVQAAWGKITLSPALEKLDFLKAGHHGSASSTGEMLASLCAPNALFISCGAGNTYGHPNLSCMKNVLAASPDAEIYRTDELGNIMLTVRDGGEYSVRFG